MKPDLFSWLMKAIVDIAFWIAILSIAIRAIRSRRMN